VLEDRGLHTEHVAYPIVSQCKRPIFRQDFQAHSRHIRGGTERQEPRRAIEDGRVPDVNLDSAPCAVVLPDNAAHFDRIVQLQPEILQ
jgi:hypothetical protein